MDLSNDLISQFVKITNDDSTGSKESTVYGTTVEYNGEMYVKLDGSDLLTPVETTADMQAGERVTVMIKNHGATVTGNITSPSANEGTVTKKVTEAVEGIEGKVITEVEILIADRVSTEQLDAELARIDELIAGKATIEQLEVIDAKIENLDVGNLEAVNAEIENLKANKAEINDLKATNAEIEILDAEFADIKTLVNGNLTSDNILSFHITADKVTMDDAFISDAMIANVSAGKINSGSINTDLVSVQSEDGALTINGSTQQFKDADGNVRIQIGKDSSGDFTFVLYGADGQGQLINQNGITASAIGDGLIVNDMVADNAAISGGKLDISSVITEINSDTSTTIKSSKIYLNEQGQSLEVAFNSLKTQVETIEGVTIEGDLSSVIEQVNSNTTQIEVNKESINTLVAEDTIIKEQITDLDGNLVSMEETLTAKYTTLEQDITGFKTSVADTYATKETVNDLSNNLSTNYSTTSVMNSAIAQSASNITSSVSSTYATKKSVADLETNLTTNYTTTTQMNSAISQTSSSLTATFTEMHNNGYEQGITTINKNGIKVTHSNSTGYTQMSATGFYINNGATNTFSASGGNVTMTGTVTATSGKIANFTIRGNDLIGSSVGMGGASGTNYAFWAGSNTSSSAPFRVSHDGALVATNANITGTVNATAGTFAGNVETTKIMKAYGAVYAGTELWGGFTKNSSGVFESLSTFSVKATNNLKLKGSYIYIHPTSGEVRIGDESSYDNLRAREIYAQEIIYVDDIRTRSVTQIGMPNISMVSGNGFIEFSSGYGVIRVPDVTHLYLQTGGGAANTSSEVRCTAYKNASIYVNLRAHNVCAQNAVYAAGVNVSSDRSRKRDIEKYQVDALNEVCSTPVYTYHLDVDKDEEMKRIGLIMQEAPVDAIDLTGQGIDLYQMCTMMWKAIQQLNAKIEG